MPGDCRPNSWQIAGVRAGRAGNRGPRRNQRPRERTPPRPPNTIPNVTARDQRSARPSLLLLCRSDFPVLSRFAAGARHVGPGFP